MGQRDRKPPEIFLLIANCELKMSFEDEDNSPFGESSYREDEFTDLPLSQGEEEVEDGETEINEATTDNSENPPVSITTSPDPDPPTVLSVPNPSNTVAYDPEQYTSTIQHSFKNEQSSPIEIVDAGKSNEGHSRGYIVYTIKFNDYVVRRRYSEFESLRKSLVRLFPTLIVPPIPEKHKITKYAAAPTKAKEDSTIIDHRRRMLGVFLKRSIDIDQIRESSVFQDFLNPNANWSEVLISPPLSNIPKNTLQSNPLDPANSSAAHSYLPIPTSSTIPSGNKPEDLRFKKVENLTREYENVISNGLEKTNKRLIKHLSDIATEYSEAGVVLNAFSLQETGKLAHVLEKIGQAHDNCFVSSESLIESLNYEFTEPLGESVQFASVVRDLLKYRQQKGLQYDMASRNLKYKTNQLKLIEKSEEGAKRIAKAIEDGSKKTGQINFDRKVAAQKQRDAEDDAASALDGSSIVPLEPKKSSSFKIPGISNLTNIIKNTIEPDSQQTREQTHSKAKEDLNQLKQTYSAAESDLKELTVALESQLKIFKKDKEANQRKMILSYARSVVEWSRKNLEYWEDTKHSLEHD